MTPAASWLLIAALVLVGLAGVYVMERLLDAAEAWWGRAVDAADRAELAQREALVRALTTTRAGASPVAGPGGPSDA